MMIRRTLVLAAIAAVLIAGSWSSGGGVNFTPVSALVSWIDDLESGGAAFESIHTTPTFANGQVSLSGSNVTMTLRNTTDLGSIDQWGYVETEAYGGALPSSNVGPALRLDASGPSDHYACVVKGDGTPLVGYVASGSTSFSLIQAGTAGPVPAAGDGVLCCVEGTGNDTEWRVYHSTDPPPGCFASCQNDCSWLQSPGVTQIATFTANPSTPVDTGTYAGIRAYKFDASNSTIINLAMAGASGSGPAPAIDPSMGVSITSVSRSVLQSTTPTADAVTLTNTGGGSYDWTMAIQGTPDDCGGAAGTGWLQVATGSGSGVTAAAPFANSITYTGFDTCPDGTYTATVRVSATGGTPSTPAITPIDIPISMTAYTSVAGTCTEVTYTARDGTTEIVFTFDQAYTCGQFAGGYDWWVQTDGGVVNITGMTPAYDTLGRNGWQVNPTNFSVQPYDQRQNFETNPNPKWDPSLIPTPNSPTAGNPYVAHGGESIIKTDSWEEAGPICKTLNSNGPCLYFAAVLTIVDEPPPGDGALVFRPPYYGTSKPYYYVADMNTAQIPVLNQTSVSGAPTLESSLAKMRPVKLDHQFSYWAQFIRPDQNLAEYPRDIALENGDAVLRAMLHLPGDDEDVRNDLYIALTQMGIDYYHLMNGGLKWLGEAGYGHGRKIAVVWAATILENQTIKNAINATLQYYLSATAAGGGGPGAHSAFGEDTQVYFSPQANSGAGLALWGAPYAGEDTYWDGAAWPGPGSFNGTRDVRDPYGYIDGSDNSGPGTDYQLCCTTTAWLGEATALNVFPELKASWQYDHFYDYVSRWMTFGAWALPDPCALTEPSPKTGVCVAGSGRFPGSHGEKDGLGVVYSSFALSMWALYGD